jgi:hypothetical protein
VPATFDAGTAGSKLHTRRRILARIFSTRFNAAGVTSSMLRHNVGGDATAPSSSDCWRSVSMSAIASPPAASIIRHIHPHPAPVMNRHEAAAAQRRGQPAVRPTRSANSRRVTAPASGTTPGPSPVTDNPCDHDVRFT